MKVNKLVKPFLFAVAAGVAAIWTATYLATKNIAPGSSGSSTSAANNPVNLL